MQQALKSHFKTFIEVSLMKNLLLGLTALFFISAPLTAFAESPLNLPGDAQAEAKTLANGISKMLNSEVMKSFLKKHRWNTLYGRPLYIRGRQKLRFYPILRADRQARNAFRHFKKCQEQIPTINFS